MNPLELSGWIAETAPGLPSPTPQPRLLLPLPTSSARARLYTAPKLDAVSVLASESQAALASFIALKQMPGQRAHKEKGISSARVLLCFNPHF